ncbi:4Fe-4S dicluster domain-containing protein [candidate division KSB1 bacterium]|nr:4Fe-4S dicluster domain-containing protein [candidate division KSB1 bacterium]
MDQIVKTIETKCKRCYSCIRNCPVKAIRVENEQAHVIAERCIACGYCVKVCPQNAKQIKDGVEQTEAFLGAPVKTIALLAPSFPAAFSAKPLQIIAGLIELGFSEVHEVAFGADLVANAYKLYLQKQKNLVISSPCPAVVNYIEKYHPELMSYLAPIVSPMVALGRAIREKYDPKAKLVFIGPCIAKKHEKDDPDTGLVIDEVLTFEELDTLFQRRHIVLSKLKEKFPTGPIADVGRIFPVSGGLLRTGEMQGDLLENDIVITEGQDRVREILSEVTDHHISAKFLDLLFCKGCINGPKMVNELTMFARKEKIVNYLHIIKKDLDHQKAAADHARYDKTNLQRSFSDRALSAAEPTERDIEKILHRIGKFSPEDELNCGACGYGTCREKAVAVFQGLAEAEMCLPYMIDKLENIKAELLHSNEELSDSLLQLSKTQDQLIQAEKLASLGQLAAGVAHELNNPLGGILLYSSLLLEKMDKNHGYFQDISQIRDETERCRKIVQGLLDFARQTRIKVAMVDLNNIIKSTLSLVVHQSMFHHIEIIKDLDPSISKVYADVGQMQQVFLNIILNAVEAMKGKGTLTLTTKNRQGEVFASIRDSGPGMTADVIKKIFDPFFTTRPQGKGTGLGLAIAYGIVQKHRGKIQVKSQPEKGAEFQIVLPGAEEYDRKAGDNQVV